MMTSSKASVSIATRQMHLSDRQSTNENPQTTIAFNNSHIKNEATRYAVDGQSVLQNQYNIITNIDPQAVKCISILWLMSIIYCVLMHILTIHTYIAFTSFYGDDFSYIDFCS